MISLIILSFVAGVLTVAAPCILPLLPVIIGGSLLDEEGAPKDKRWVRPLIIAVSLAVSVVVFTLLIKATTALLGVPTVVWQVVSGGIVILLGLHFIWPGAWEHISSRSGLFTRSNKLLGNAYRVPGLMGAIVVGAALGPVFSSCSPTYALIVATVLPVSFAEGFVYLVAYAVGMSGTLLVVTYAGQFAIGKLKWLSNPSGWFKRLVGVVFVIVGMFVLFGWDKKLQTYVLDQGWYEPIANLERKLHDD